RHTRWPRDWSSDVCSSDLTKYGQQAQFDPTVTDPLTGKLGAIVHKSGQLAKKDLNNFAPRFGLAWNFRPKFVFRGSFGMVHADRSEERRVGKECDERW